MKKQKIEIFQNIFDFVFYLLLPLSLVNHIDMNFIIAYQIGALIVNVARIGNKM